MTVAGQGRERIRPGRRWNQWWQYMLNLVPLLGPDPPSWNNAFASDYDGTSLSCCIEAT